MAAFPRLEELVVVANSSSFFDGIMLYIERETTIDLEFVADLHNLFAVGNSNNLTDAIRVNELRLLTSELNVSGGPLAVQCAEFLKQLSQKEAPRMLELRKMIAKVHL
ncbi:hypothetical protein Tco_0965372 [Tanacetum coccineum]